MLGAFFQKQLAGMFNFLQRIHRVRIELQAFKELLSDFENTGNALLTKQLDDRFEIDQLLKVNTQILGGVLGLQQRLGRNFTIAKIFSGGSRSEDDNLRIEP